MKMKTMGSGLKLSLELTTSHVPAQFAQQVTCMTYVYFPSLNSLPILSDLNYQH